mmetsp:Transcript_4497/g.6757  ORF Transcript_4497/g.6757 Transcript_4497/m.6757 type:complete len:89 (+) Transcript_4497:974-1240(+)
MMIDITDFYLEEKSPEQSPKKNLKLNKGLQKKFAEDEASLPKDEGQIKLEEKLSEDIRSDKLTNRSIHSIKKYIMRERAFETTPEDLL